MADVDKTQAEVAAKAITLTVGAVTDMFIKANACRCLGLRITKPKKAVEAVAAVAAIRAKKAIAEVKGKDGVVTTASVPAVAAAKAVKAKEGREAVPGYHKICIQARSQEVMEETLARLADMGYPLQDDKDSVVKEVGGYGISVWLKFGDDSKEAMSTFRGIFKKVKSKDHYNKAGAEKAEEETAAKQKVDAEAKKAERDAKKAAAKKAADAKKAAAKKAADDAPVIKKGDPTLKDAKTVASAKKTTKAAPKAKALPVSGNTADEAWPEDL